MTDGRDKMAATGLGHVIGLLLAVPRRPFELGAVLLLAMGAIAVESVREGLLPYVPAGDPAPEAEDPVLAEIGPVPLRLSDVRAQAGPGAAETPIDVLEAQGHLDAAADQLALALAAEEEGLDEALEVRAALALARRRVLSEAYLDLAVSEAVSEEALQAAYRAEVEALADERLISLRHILVATREEAEALAARLKEGADFGRLAERHSLDETSRDEGGSYGMTPVSALPPTLVRASAGLPVGVPSPPFQTEAGWHLVRVDARRVLATPPFEERRPALAAMLREKAIEDAVARAAAARARRRRMSEAAAPGAERPGLGMGRYDGGG